jgi:phage gp46-like protein
MLDIALIYDPETRCADMAFNGRDFVVDTTPATPLIISVGCERRARPDDVLPDAVSDFLKPSTFIAARGSPCDSLNPPGRLTGSRMWLLQRQKQTEAVRKAAETYLAEACDRFNTDLGLAVQITVRWLRPGMLGYRVRVGTTELALQMAVGS